MSFTFKELDFQSTPLGDISLRKRADTRLGGKILYEVKLNDEFLMSSLFTEAEEQLANIGLAALAQGRYANDALDVVVGGLGLGYTALAALENKRVRSLQVIDVMEAVIRWHQTGLIPWGKALCEDPRTRLRQADFFAVAGTDSNSFDVGQSEAKVHAVLLDIDHSPSYWLNQENSNFYTAAQLSAMAQKIHPGGVFGLWSDEPPEPEFVARLQQAFTSVETHVITFPNPYTLGESSNSVYIARTAQ